MILIDHLLCHARSLSRPLFVMPVLVMPRHEASLLPCHAEERGISLLLCHAEVRGIFPLSCRGTRHLFFFVMPSLLCHAEARGIFSLSCRGTRHLSSSLSCRGTRHLSSPLSCRGTRHLFFFVMPRNEASFCHAEARGISSPLSCRAFFVMPRHEASLLPCHAGVRGISLVIPVQRPSQNILPMDHLIRWPLPKYLHIQKFKARIKRLYQIKLLISSPAFYFLLSCNSDIDILV